MRISTVTFLALSALLLSGCTYSVHPILLDSDLTTDVDLSGTWALEADASDRNDWGKFSMQSVDGGATYRGATDDGKEFVAQIGKLGDERYLQFSMLENTEKKQGLLSSIPIYVIARFETSDDALHFFPISQDRAIPYFDKHDIHYRLIETGVKHCVLTDDTSRLQKLLADHGDELFSEHALTFTRKSVITKDTRSAAEANRREREDRPASAAGDKDRDRRNRNATRGLPPDKEKAEAIRKLEFLAGTWESVEPDHAPPAPEIRTITAQPDGMSLIVTTESVLETGRPVHITFDLKSQEYLLTHTNSDGEKRVFHAKLTADNKLESPVPESAALFSGLNFIVTVKDGQWTETVSRPSNPDETFYRRSFLRRDRTP